MAYARTIQRPKQRQSQLRKLPAPIAGWISNRALAVPNGQDGKAPQGAAILDNFIPKATSVILRRGSLRYCTLGDGTEDATALFSYNVGTNKRQFGATDTTIYDITDVEFADDAEIATYDGDLITDDMGNVFGWSSTEFLSVMEGFTGGDWSVVQFASSGGIFLIGVNGQDTGFIYDGEYFYPYVAGGVYQVPYDNESTAFTVGEDLTGGTSGAIGVIWRVIDNGGGEGVLFVTDVVTTPITYDLDYDSGTGDFVPGETITGGTSGATATVDSVSGTTASGTLTISGLTGSFEASEALTGDIAGVANVTSPETYASGGIFRDNEALTDTGGGSADVNGNPFVAAPGPDFGALTSADMSFVWAYKNRLYFVQKDTLDAWYLDVDAVGGEATKFPMAGIFNLGGSLLFGQRWSLSSGGDGGLSEQNAFVSTEGEVAIFQGLSPDDTASWSQVGVYRIGRPLGKNAFIRGAGDLAIATSIGLIPLSKAIELDLTALSVASISYPIADAWGSAVDQRGLEAWHGEIWPEQKIAAFAPPTGLSGLPPVLFVSNTETGAWTRFTGWDVKCMNVFEGRLFFGSTGGRVFLANETGEDDGLPYTGAIIPLFDDFGAPGARKLPRVGRYITRSSAKVSARISWQGDYSETLPSAPNATDIMGGSAWGTGIWGESQWAERLPRLLNDGWKSVGGAGYTGSLAYQVTSGSLQPLDDEIISAEVAYETTELMG